MNPGGEGFTPQINNATAPSLQPNQPIPQQIPQINTHPNPLQNQSPQQQVPAMASAAQSPELEASTPVTGKSRIESAWDTSSAHSRSLIKSLISNILYAAELNPPTQAQD